MSTYVNVTVFPPNTTIYVNSVANAALTQTVTITPPSGTAAIFSGTGEGNTTMAVTQAGFLRTPGGGAQPCFTTASGASGTYQVTISSSAGAENVQFAQCSSSWTSGASANVFMVVSEDMTDQDYNDSVVFFTWYTPANPEARARKRA